MDLYQILTVVTCATSTLTAIVVCVALLPHVKDGMVIIRDAMLWLALIALLALLGWLGFEHIQNQQVSSPVEPVAPASVSPLSPDRFYAGR